MSETTGNRSRTLTCVAIGALVGTLTTILLFVLGVFSGAGAVFAGLVVAVIVAVFLLMKAAPMKSLSRDRRAPGVSRTSNAVPAAADPIASMTPAPVAAPMPELDPVTDPEPAPAPDPEPTSAAGSEPAPAPVAAPAPAAAADADLPPVAADGKPALLTAPRDGGADDLKKIKGVGPKLEGMLNDMGVYHFDQIASWRAPEVAWVNDNLDGFRGRVSRDNWVDQAAVLAAGGRSGPSDNANRGDA